MAPASSSSQFSIGVTSTARSGPKLDPPSLRFQLTAPPSSTTAAGSLSDDCASAFPEQRDRHVINTVFVAFTTTSTDRRDALKLSHFYLRRKLLKLVNSI